jgi:hypothetical protein
MNHEFKITNIVRISEHSDLEELKTLLENEAGDFSNLPFKELTEDDFEFFEDWVYDQQKINNGFLFKASAPIVTRNKNSVSFSWGYYEEILMYANSFEEAEFKAQEYANTVYNY